jgi:hypothetical protein
MNIKGLFIFILMETALEKSRQKPSYKAHIWVGTKWNETLGVKGVVPK